MPAQPEASSGVPPVAAADRYARGLAIVRLAWIILAALILGLFAAAVPAEYALLQIPCATPICTTEQLPAAGLTALAELGLSPAFYAAATVVMDVIFAVVYV